MSWEILDVQIQQILLDIPPQLRLFNFVSPLLNERMQAKIQVRATGIPFEDDSCHLMVMRNTTRTSDLSMYIFESWNVLKHLDTSWYVLRHLETDILRQTSWDILRHLETSWDILKPTKWDLKDIAGLMEARAIHSLVDVSCGHLSWSHLLLPSGGNVTR